MLSIERQRNISDFLKEDGNVKVSELSKKLNVSEETIRRDLKVLEKKGLLHRIHGGGISFNHVRIEPYYKAKMYLNIIQKQKIAFEAAKIIEEGDTIIIDSSTTSFYLAKEIRKKQNITIVTNCLLNIQELAGFKNITILLTGGLFNNSSYSSIGPIAEDFIKKIHVDYTFISTKAISIESGLMEGDINNIAIKRCMIDAGNKIILLADSSKFNNKSFFQLVPLSIINTVIVDNDIDQELVEKIKQIVSEVIIAGR